MVGILKSYGIISGLIAILIVVVMISGCTSSGNGTSGNGTTTIPQYKSDINVSAASYTYFNEDGSASGGCDVRNTGNIE